MDTTSLVIVDDDPIVRDALRAVICRSPWIICVAVFSDGLGAVRHAQSSPANAYLVDVNMPNMDGITTAAKIRQIAPSSRVVLLTALNKPGLGLVSESVGASETLLKTASPQEIVKAILGGGPEITAPRSSVVGKQELSARELEVLEFLCQAKSNCEIADILCISESTVKAHVGQILHKLDAKSRLEAVVYAMRSGVCQI